MKYTKFLIALVLMVQLTSVFLGWQVRGADLRTIRAENKIAAANLSIDAARKACENLNEMKAIVDILVLNELNQPVPKNLTFEQYDLQVAYREVLRVTHADSLKPVNCKAIK